MHLQWKIRKPRRTKIVKWGNSLGLRVPEAPDRGDLVWLEIDPQAEHEPAGRRPALVISPSSYSSKVGSALFCPITSRVRDYPFEVILPEGGEVSGAVLADQIKSLDWRARKAERIAAAPSEVMREVLANIRVLVS